MRDENGGEGGKGREGNGNGGEGGKGRRGMGIEGKEGREGRGRGIEGEEEMQRGRLKERECRRVEARGGGKLTREWVPTCLFR